jgi:hypothetical protein
VSRHCVTVIDSGTSQQRPPLRSSVDCSLPFKRRLPGQSSSRVKSTRGSPSCSGLSTIPIGSPPRCPHCSRVNSKREAGAADVPASSVRPSDSVRSAGDEPASTGALQPAAERALSATQDQSSTFSFRVTTRQKQEMCPSKAPKHSGIYRGRDSLACATLCHWTVSLPQGPARHAFGARCRQDVGDRAASDDRRGTTSGSGSAHPQTPVSVRMTPDVKLQARPTAVRKGHCLLQLLVGQRLDVLWLSPAC